MEYAIFPNVFEDSPPELRVVSGQNLSCVHPNIHHDGEKEPTGCTGHSLLSPEPGRISATVGTGTLPISLF